jgi:hypothetical protein
MKPLSSCVFFSKFNYAFHNCETNKNIEPQPKISVPATPPHIKRKYIKRNFVSTPPFLGILTAKSLHLA